MDYMICENCGEEFAANKGFGTLCWDCANFADEDVEEELEYDEY